MDLSDIENTSSNFVKDPYIPSRKARIHRYWWTILPAVPSKRNSQEYYALRRLWGDPTINVFKDDGEGGYRHTRGPYVEGHEEHIQLVTFQNWSLFPEPSWASAFLRSCGAVTRGAIRRVRWSYDFVQDDRVIGKKCADIVFEYEDDEGRAVLVLEAKRKGNVTLGAKDSPDTTAYLRMPNIREYERRRCALLIDDRDIPEARRLVGDRASILSWQRLAGLQIESALALSLPESIKSFIVGAIMSHAARCGFLPAPLPYDWLYQEPNCLDLKNSVQQSGRDRRVPYWNLDWSVPHSD